MAATTLIAVGWRGVDYAFARPNPVAMKAAGVTFVCRYASKIKPNGTWNPKDVTPAEVAALHAAGIALILNWEQSAGDALGGASLGSMHGIAAKARAETLGYPHELPIVKSCDTGVTRAQLPTVEAHLRAFAAAIAPYPLGVYGGTTVIDLVGDICVLGWQANASSWSPHPSSNVHVRQRTQAADHQTDPNECVQPFAAWLPHPDREVELKVEVEAPAAQGGHKVSAFTHSDNDHEGHPARWSYWVLMPDGTKRHIGEVELGILGTRDTAPAMTMAQIDQLPDWVAPATGTGTDPASHGTWAAT